MRGAAYRHIGGMVTADHGPLTLAAARDLVAFYAREAAHAPAPGPRSWSGLCRARAVALAGAVAAAEQWRRASGWKDPDAADGRPGGALAR